MNEPTPNELSAHDDETAWDTERPMSPNFNFSKEERDIVIKCINIFIDEYYFHDRDFRTLMDSDARPRLIRITDKIKNNVDLDKQDGKEIGQVVMHVSMFPMMHGDEVEKQFDFDLRHLFWFSAHIRETFEETSEE